MGRTIWKKAQQTQPRESIHKRVYRIIKEKMQIDKRNTLQKVRIRGQDKLPHHNGDCKKKVIDKNNEKCYFVEVVIQFVHLRVTTEEIENRICDLNNVGC